MRLVNMVFRFTPFTFGQYIALVRKDLKPPPSNAEAAVFVLGEI
jgi:hypothetical protein